MLSDARSSKRRLAAKRLRRLADARAAEALVVALQKEVTGRGTWETQYQMIMAIGSCVGNVNESSNVRVAARRLLEQILSLELEPMVHVAAGDILVRVSEGVDAAVLVALESGSLSRAVGAVRALAMAKLVPAESTVQA